MRTRTLVAATMALFVGVVPATAGTALITPTGVLGGPEYQYLASSNGQYMGWTQNSVRKPRSWHAYVSIDPAVSKVRLDEPGTNGFFGDIDADPNEAIYQQTDGGVSDLYFFDVATLDRTPPTGINTGRWEWQPRLSDDYVLFTRDYPRAGVRRLLLYDRTTFGIKRLKEVPFGTLLITGDVGASYATWTTCKRTCNAWIYDIDGPTTLTKIPTVNDKPQYAPVVDEVNRYVYWVRSKPACGAGVRFLKAPVATPELATRIAVLPAGFDTEWKSSLEHDTVNNRVDLIFSRYNCSTGDASIFELQAVDAA
jgi:hypothetical protein